MLRPILLLLFVNDTPPQPSRSSIDIFADNTTEEQLVHTKERRKRKSEDERRGEKSNRCTLSFYNGYFGDFWTKKQLLEVTFSWIRLDVFFEVCRCNLRLDQNFHVIHVRKYRVVKFFILTSFIFALQASRIIISCNVYLLQGTPISN